MKDTFKSIEFMVAEEAAYSAMGSRLSTFSRLLYGRLESSRLESEVVFCGCGTGLANLNRATVQTQGRNIRSYAEYLHQRAKSYGQTKLDYVRIGEGRLKKLTVEKGLLRETEIVQDQIRALIRCDVRMGLIQFSTVTDAF